MDLVAINQRVDAWRDYEHPYIKMVPITYGELHHARSHTLKIRLLPQPFPIKALITNTDTDYVVKELIAAETNIFDAFAKLVTFRDAWYMTYRLTPNVPQTNWVFNDGSWSINTDGTPLGGYMTFFTSLCTESGFLSGYNNDKLFVRLAGPGNQTGITAMPKPNVELNTIDRIVRQVIVEHPARVEIRDTGDKHYLIKIDDLEFKVYSAHPDYDAVVELLR
jgi:hypothetical protein